MERYLGSDLEFGWRRHGNRLSRVELRARSDGLDPGEGRGWWEKEAWGCSFMTSWQDPNK